MLLNELARESGVSVASIKYYRREGLLAPGRRVTTTRFDYGPAHLERLALIRELRESADAPIADIRLLTSVIDEGRPLVSALEIAQAIASGLPARHHGSPPPDEDPRTSALIARVEWPDVGSGPRAALDLLLQEMGAAGVDADLPTLLRYARPLEGIAREDLAGIVAEGGSPRPSTDVIVRRALVGSLAFTRLTIVLRALAHASLSLDPDL